MAGMLPGVECARRRRFHQGGAAMELQSGTRRSSFCLYNSGHEYHLRSSSVKRSASNMSTQSEGLGEAARAAKERLDGKLRAQRVPGIRRHDSTGSLSPITGGDDDKGLMVVSTGALANLQREVFCWKKKKKISRGKLFGWSRGLGGWKGADQDDDCAVCLEEFKDGDMLVHLPCAHRFHWRCLLPWLQSNSHCPCCRTEVTSS